MPIEQINKVLEECADNAQEVEIQFIESQTNSKEKSLITKYIIIPTSHNVYYVKLST